MNRKDEAIVVFDSGIGGLTTLCEIEKLNLRGPFVYLADTLNTPYGDKTKEEIVQFVLQAFRKLEQHYHFSAIILACNTAAAYTTHLLETIYKVPVYTVTNAAIEYAKQLKTSSTIDVLATQLTTNSHIYKNNLLHTYIKELSCPTFVPFIESAHYPNRKKRKNIVEESLIGRSTEQGEFVILGCTHYPLLKEEIQHFYGHQVQIIDPSFILADSIQPILGTSSKAQETRFFITKSSVRFNLFASSFLKKDIVGISLHDNLKRKFL